MDPVANMLEQRRLATAAQDTPLDYEDAARLAELVLALDEWRRHGGFDPYDGQSLR